jgi:ankyrin repeat protein
MSAATTATATRIAAPPDLGPKLVRAAARSDDAAVEELLGRGADANVADTRPSVDGPEWTRLTPLHWACRNGADRSASRLIEAGASIAAEDSWGRQPLAHACEFGRIQCVRVLIGYKDAFDINATDFGGWTALARAATTTS